MYSAKSSIGSAGAVFSVVLMALAQLTLLATLRNTTNRTSFVRARSILDGWNRADLYVDLLSFAGSLDLDNESINEQANRFVKTFDYAATVVHTEFPAVDFIDPLVRDMLADGVVELIESGNAKEAVPFILNKHGAAMAAVENDAPPSEQHAWCILYLSTLTELGLVDLAGLRRKADQA